VVCPCPGPWRAERAQRNPPSAAPAPPQPTPACGCAASAPIAGVVAGVCALGEALPSSSGGRWVRYSAWAAIIVGVSGLAAGAAGLRQMGAAAAGEGGGGGVAPSARGALA